MPRNVVKWMPKLRLREDSRDKAIQVLVTENEALKQELSRIRDDHRAKLDHLIGVFNETVTAIRKAYTLD